MAWTTVVDNRQYAEYTWDADIPINASIVLADLILPRGAKRVFMIRALDAGTITGTHFLSCDLKVKKPSGTFALQGPASFHTGAQLLTGSLSSTNFSFDNSDGVMAEVLFGTVTFGSAQGNILPPVDLAISWDYDGSAEAGTANITDFTMMVFKESA